MVTVFLYVLDSIAFPVIEKKYPDVVGQDTWENRLLDYFLVSTLNFVGENHATGVHFTC